MPANSAQEKTDQSKISDIFAANDPSPQAAEVQPPWTHQAYTLYIRDEADLIGLVAYSLYKQHKIAFLKSEHSRYESHATPATVRTFCDAYSEPKQVELLREKAAKLLEEMNEELLDEAVTALNSSYDKRLKKELKEGTPFWKSVRYSVAGNIATGIVFASIVWAANANFDQLIGALKKLFNIS